MPARCGAELGRQPSRVDGRCRPVWSGVGWGCEAGTVPGVELRCWGCARGTHTLGNDSREGAGSGFGGRLVRKRLGVHCYSWDCLDLAEEGWGYLDWVVVQGEGYAVFFVGEL